MNRRILVALVVVLALGSGAAAVVWQQRTDAPEMIAQGGAAVADAAPSSRSIFPKVLNH